MIKAVKSMIGWKKKKKSKEQNIDPELVEYVANKKTTDKKIPSFVGDNQKYDIKAFVCENCTSTNQVEIPEGFNSNSFYHSCVYCGKLTEIDYNKANNSIASNKNNNNSVVYYRKESLCSTCNRIEQIEVPYRSSDLDSPVYAYNCSGCGSDVTLLRKMMNNSNSTGGITSKAPSPSPSPSSSSSSPAAAFSSIKSSLNHSIQNVKSNDAEYNDNDNDYEVSTSSVFDVSVSEKNNSVSAVSETNNSISNKINKINEIIQSSNSNSNSNSKTDLYMHVNSSSYDSIPALDKLQLAFLKDKSSTTSTSPNGFNASEITTTHDNDNEKGTVNTIPIPELLKLDKESLLEYLKTLDKESIVEVIIALRKMSPRQNLLSSDNITHSPTTTTLEALFRPVENNKSEANNPWDLLSQLKEKSFTDYQNLTRLSTRLLRTMCLKFDPNPPADKHDLIIQILKHNLSNANSPSRGSPFEDISQSSNNSMPNKQLSQISEVL